MGVAVVAGVGGLGATGGHDADAVESDDADVSRPVRGVGEKRPDERGQMRCCRRMGSKQDNAGVFEWGAALESDLPEVLVEGQQDSRFGLVNSRRVAFGHLTQSVLAHMTSCPPLRKTSTNGFGKFSAASRRIYAGIG